MPIAYGDIDWPPAYCREPNRLHREYRAWYSGDPQRLVDIYGGGTTGAGVAIPSLVDHPSQFRGGIAGAIARFWWGRPINATQNTTRLHVPAPADVSSFSSDLLYQDPLNYSLPEDASDAADARLSTIIDSGSLHARLLELGETTSYSGGGYLVAYVDDVVAKVPLTAVYSQGNAVPEWRNGYLRAVTFWRCLDDGTGDGNTVWRHLERHEPGVVYHALYKGTPSRLGTVQPLQDRPETADLATRVDESGALPTGVPMLDVNYIPNMLPNRAMEGSPLGNSDYDQATPLFDALDETWASWMRDIRMAKARLVVPRGYLQSMGPGQGASFDMEQEVFTAVNTLGGQDKAMQLEQVQFDIRVEQHERTAAAQWRMIMRHVGLSQGAFGEESDGGGAATAKEIGQRGERTGRTRNRKILYARPGITAHVSVLQALDVAHFAPTGGVPVMPVSVDWPAEMPDLETMGRTLQLLDAAAAVSTKIKVAMLHPRWSESQVDDEVTAIDASKAVPSMPDPGTFTGA
jgi:hypothetical protein